VNGRRATTETLRWTQTLGSVAAAVTVAAMVATPLARRGGGTRRVLSSIVVTALAATTASRATARWGPARAAGALATVGAGTLVVERVGTRTGVPFGRYHYSPALRPQIGGVPIVVPLAWFAMALPAREAAIAALGERASPVRRIVAGAAALTAFDLFLDPQMVGEGYWHWPGNGAYRGIPLSNLVGWLVTGLAIMAVLELVVPPAPPPDPALVGEYAVVGVMETFAFAAFFRDRLVAAVGGAAMLPIAALATRNVCVRLRRMRS
jgi:uncharacterized membrane protein